MAMLVVFCWLFKLAPFVSEACLPQIVCVERQGGSSYAMQLANSRCMQIRNWDSTKNIIMEDSTDTFVKKFNGEETFGVGEEAVSNGSSESDNKDDV